MTASIEEIRTIEFRTLRAWQAVEEVEYDGWILTFAGGYTRRANSVHPVHPSTLDLDEKIAHCEAVYAARSLPCHFRLHPAVPEDLDTILAARGYHRDVDTPVLVRDLATLEPAPADEGWVFGERLTPEVTDEWLAAFAAFTGTPPDPMTWLRRILAAIDPETAFVTMYDDATPVAVALGVLDGAWMGIYDVAVRPEYRRRGLGDRVVRHLLRWGAGRGAATGYLQVFGDNAPALALYARMAFTEAYRYWYRSGPGRS